MPEKNAYGTSSLLEVVDGGGRFAAARDQHHQAVDVGLGLDRRDPNMPAAQEGP